MLIRQKYIPAVMLFFLFGSASYPLPGQTLEPDLDKVSKSVENYFRHTRPEWKHEIVPPAMPPGSPPNPVVVIHFWSSEKCLSAEVIIDGVNSGKHPVSCRVKLAIDKSSSASAARTRLSDFVQAEPSATPISIGEKGYIWRGADVVFIKGQFTFWLSGYLDLRVGDFTKNREFMEQLAKEFAEAADTP